MAVPVEHQHDPQFQGSCAACDVLLCEGCCDEHFTSECLPLLWHESADRVLTAERYEFELVRIEDEALGHLIAAMIQARAATHDEAPSEAEFAKMYKRASQLYGVERFKQFKSRRLSELLREFKLSPDDLARLRAEKRPRAAAGVKGAIS
jgi:hypothetical protein